MEEEVEAVRQQVEHAALILEEVKRCQSGAAASSLADKEQVYCSLKARYREEYILYNLADAALSQVRAACWSCLHLDGTCVLHRLHRLCQGLAGREMVWGEVGDFVGRVLESC
jgi:hypothetical protein